MIWLLPLLSSRGKQGGVRRLKERNRECVPVSMASGCMLLSLCQVLSISARRVHGEEREDVHLICSQDDRGNL